MSVMAYMIPILKLNLVKFDATIQLMMILEYIQLDLCLLSLDFLCLLINVLFFCPAVSSLHC